jgi:ATP-dependent DNA helicase DinG
MNVAAHLGPAGSFARILEGYEHRESQIAMASAVEKTLRDGGLLMVEAGTGTGKTLAYLLPALLSGERVVISTGTRNLQDQILEQDVPLLERVLGRSIDVTCMKGLSNYVCLRRTAELMASARAMEPAVGKKLPLLERFLEATTTGDRAELRELPEDDPLWALVTSGSETRIGPRCAHYDDCYVTRMRRRAEESELVVVNHHLFFADLAMRASRAGAGVIPDYDAVVFDEAHQIEDVVTVFFGVQVAQGRIERLLRDATSTTGKKGAALLDEDAMRSHAEGVARRASELFESLPRPQEGSRRELDVSSLGSEVESRYFALDTALEGLSSHATRRAGERESIAQLARRAEAVRDDLARVFESHHGPRVAWVSRAHRGLTLGASPLEVGPLLREHLFDRTHAVVLASATLSTGGDMGFIAERLGVRESKDVVLPSPFDYPTQAALYVADHLPDPRDADYLEAAAREILALIEITGGGAFVLCTSHKMMRALAAECRESIRHPVLVQGDAPKPDLLERFRSEGDAVLFATSSFWEGVDVPGHALRLVIVDKLPFESPDDPLTKARAAALEARGENAFKKLFLPSAALSLKQGFGRLIRTRRDRGVVAILDSRLVKKSYGKVMLKSLPDASRCYSIDEVRAFWKGLSL